MPDGVEDKLSQTGKFKHIDKEPRLEREKQPPPTLPEFESQNPVGSTTGIIRIRREADDDNNQGDEDNPVENG